MIRVIDGKRYDTEKSKKVGSKSNGKPYNDFDVYGKILYRTQNGNYFFNEYAHQHDVIIPCDVDEAFEFLSKYEHHDQEWMEHGDFKHMIVDA